MNTPKRSGGRTSRVAEPVQVYLHADDQDRLTRLTERLGTTKSDVLRRGLEALEREVRDPAAHPALKLVGLGASHLGTGGGLDAARDHDAVLADGEVRSWSADRERDVAR
jgi:predicted DNA-binding protein